MKWRIFEGDRVHLIRGLKATGQESGQVLVLFAFWLPLLLLFTGLSIDFGFGFLTKAELAKSVDAAALTITRNLGQGQTAAAAMGTAQFYTNYNANPKVPNVAAPTLSVTFATDSFNEPVVNVKATATIHTFFIGLAGFPTLTVSNYSQAVRPPVILTLVLDHSGSMTHNGGEQALPGAVTSFLANFIEGTDQVGEVSFGSTANVDVPISYTFKTAINNALTAMPWGGATYAQGGLLDAQTQVTGVSNPPVNAVDVVVFFTDGYANTNNDNLACGPTKSVNYGGCSPIEQPIYNCGFSFLDPTTGNTTTCGATTFTPHDPTLPSPALLNNGLTTLQDVSDDAMYRAVQLANTMRTQGITIYSIGMGDLTNTDYLYELANDPNNPTSSEYNPSSQPSGLYEPAGTSADLEAAFQQVAQKILDRLSN
jgi:Flp pilus assembly protein TadG